MYGGQPVGKPEYTWTDAVTRDVRKRFGTARRKRLVLDRKMWGRKTEEATTKIWAVNHIIIIINLSLPFIRWWSGKSRSQQIKAIYPSTYQCCMQCSL